MRAPVRLGEVAVGEPIPELSRTVTQAQIDAYALAAADPNPIHTDAEVARAFGFESTIAHGMLSMAILAEAVATWAGAYERLASLTVRFSRPLYSGSTLTCRGSVVAVDRAAALVTLDLEAVSDRGERVLTNGRATVRLSASS